MNEARDARFWDRAATKYAKSKIADEAGYTRSLERTAGLLRPDMQVLELGCGTGSTALRLAGGVEGYTGTDISPGMIEIANAKAAEAPDAGLNFRAATAEDMAREPMRWDAVLGFNYLHLVEDLPATLRHIADLLVPGGLFVSKTTCLSDMSPLIQYLALPLMRLVGMAPTVIVFSADDLQQAIRDASFEIEAVERHASKGRDARPYIVARKP
ncbi:class I SAM-dependent methyltransferase [Psychromarinibacter halotolerans]|uniref:Class I SAM-dependent methyltransferase n=1 Tax=Psychromarinibacter halotolerans TaxID=1775175 RepID=A0ABV7GS00_9RHOB|nr:class I SAM-dependent methyltransferase [Psychromarinibacter halotolerans]MDF0597142.1 class I SAM-dependent methyltransferase [Psychromarinibacter halotolerans]